MPIYDSVLRYFLAVFETGSINGAARKLYVASSAVSRQISNLEREVGAALFERRPGGMIPTEAGHAFVGYARQAVQQAGQVVERIREVQSADAVIEIAAPNGIGHQFLAGVAADYRFACGSARFVLRLPEPAVATQLVRDGAVDVAVTFTLAIDRGVRIVYSAPAPLMAVMRVGHPLADRRLLTLAEVSKHPLAINAANTTGRQLLDVVSASNDQPIEPVFVCDNPDAMVRFVSGSEAITFLSHITVLADIERGAVVMIPLREKGLRQRNLQVHTQAGRQLPTAIEGFVEHLVAALDRIEL